MYKSIYTNKVIEDQFKLFKKGKAVHIYGRCNHDYFETLLRKSGITSYKIREYDLDTPTPYWRYFRITNKRKRYNAYEIIIYKNGVPHLFEKLNEASKFIGKSDDYLAYKVHKNDLSGVIGKYKYEIERLWDLTDNTFSH